MINWHPLALALERIEQNDHWLDGAPSSGALAIVLSAARERLAQLSDCPESDCDGGILKVGSMKNWTPHATCHATGKVYPSEEQTDNDGILLRLKAEWYRNGMQDVLRTRTLNGVPPLSAREIRERVAGFSEQFWRPF